MRAIWPIITTATAVWCDWPDRHNENWDSIKKLFKASKLEKKKRAERAQQMCTPDVEAR